MGIKNVYDVAARAMSAQIVRMNTIATNLANASNVTSSEETAYKPLRPVFKTVYADQSVKKVNVDLSAGKVLVAYLDTKKIDIEEIKNIFLINGQTATKVVIREL